MGPDPAKSGFTLTELLVVLAVIALLAGLATTAAGGALRKARETHCINNLKQLHAALASFTSLHGEYPRWTNPEDDGGQTNAWLWPHVLEREMGGTGYPPDRFVQSLRNSVWDCPSAPRPPKTVSDFDYGYNTKGLGWRLGSMPLGLAGRTFTVQRPGQPIPEDSPVKEGDVAHPARMIALGDGFIGWNGEVCISSSFIRSPFDATEFQKEGDAASRHRKRANAVFCDGHVETLSFTTLFTDSSDEALKLWNRDHLPHRERLIP
ncbi:MAG: DUF1559 domain-containing protein [Verrucomicrobiae bacterium]|nr:DUF1559 domain-containing protein [Verrucomicrobiae bacterium]